MDLDSGNDSTWSPEGVGVGALEKCKETKKRHRTSPQMELAWKKRTLNYIVKKITDLDYFHVASVSKFEFSAALPVVFKDIESNTFYM